MPPLPNANSALDDLVALALVPAPRVEPDVDPVLHVAEQPERDVGRAGEQHRAEHEEAGLLGGHPQQDDEQGEEQQRRAEVAAGRSSRPR